MKRHVIVFEDRAADEKVLKAFIDTLDDGAQMWSFYDRACFLKSRLSAQEVSDRFLKFAGSSLFVVADISSSECSGRMFGLFWDFMKNPSLPTAAE